MPKSAGTGCRRHHTLLVMNVNRWHYFWRGTIVPKYLQDYFPFGRHRWDRAVSHGSASGHIFVFFQRANKTMYRSGQYFPSLVVLGMHRYLRAISSTIELLNPPF